MAEYRGRLNGLWIDLDSGWPDIYGDIDENV